MYRSWFQRMSAPRWRIAGFEDIELERDDGDVESELEGEESAISCEGERRDRMPAYQPD